MNGLSGFFEGILLTVSPLAMAARYLVLKERTVLSPRSGNFALLGSGIPILGRVLADLGSVDITIVSMLSLVFLGLPLAVLFLQCPLYALVGFASCHRSNSSVRVAGKSRSWRKILANTHLVSEEVYKFFCHLRSCYHTQGRKHP